MRVIAVPVRRLDSAKTRLAAVLSPGERATLVLAMLDDVLAASLAQRSWETWVISGDERVLARAAEHGAATVLEEGQTLLSAVRQVERAAIDRSAESLAVLLGDVPLISAAALADSLDLAAPVVAARAASDGGTNLLVRRPPDAIPPRFGRASFHKHCWAARRARLEVARLDRPELAFDLDRPEDIESLLKAGGRSRARSACLEMGMTARLRARA
jgi:2-phospho-L-lactate/phosphoenolpyruvate guanylyltransferase